MKRYFILLFLICLFFNCYSQNDTIKKVNKPYGFEYSKMYVPIGLMMLGEVLDGNQRGSVKNGIVDFRNNHFSYGHQTRVDDYIQYIPFFSLYFFELIGMEARSNWKKRTFILLTGEVINLGTVHILKNYLNRKRPEGTPRAFPSGHTAHAFAGATMLAIEYGGDNRWVPYFAYSVASTVGIMRMVNNKHYISDVLFGAGLGILSIKLAYWIHKKSFKSKKKSLVDPLEGKYY